FALADPEVDDAVVDTGDGRGGQLSILGKDEALASDEAGQPVAVRIEDEPGNLTHLLAIAVHDIAALADNGVLQILPLQRLPGLTVKGGVAGRHSRLREWGGRE